MKKKAQNEKKAVEENNQKTEERWQVRRMLQIFDVIDQQSNNFDFHHTGLRQVDPEQPLH